jgi:hypothetical protein
VDEGQRSTNRRIAEGAEPPTSVQWLSIDPSSDDEYEKRVDETRDNELGSRLLTKRLAQKQARDGLQSVIHARGLGGNVNHFRED